ncbi:MAG: T9SS type A sorting domain-containing protein [Candidatus Kapabacteria bacterium]|nr:T9SS type A sorting domain-containing protein [Candidatus Kapabacteria bacterium]
MKNILQLYILSVLICSTAALMHVKAQWIDKGEYKEIKVSDSTIKQIVQVEGEPYFWMMTADTIIQKYDSDGKFVKNFHSDLLMSGFLTPPYVFHIPFNLNQLSSDGKEFITSNIFPCDSNKSVGYFCNIFNLDSSSLILKNYNFGCYPLNTSMYASLEFATVALNYIDYSSTLNEIIFAGNYDYMTYAPYHEWGYYSSLGNVHYIYKPPERVLKGFQSPFSISKDKNYLLGLTHNSTSTHVWLPNPPPDTFSESYYFCLNNFHISSFYRNSTNIALPGYFPSQCCLANYDTTFITQISSTLYFYKFTQIGDTAWRVGQLTLPYQPLNYIYSISDKFLIIATPNNTIDLLHISTQKTVKTYKLLDCINSSYLTTFENGFLSGNSEGSIKYFTLTDSLINSVESNPYSDELSTTAFPNPASDQINFEINFLLNSEVRLSIYNSIGEEGFQSKIHRNQFSLDVDKFYDGIYYYHISSGGKSCSGSFVKW